MGYPRDIGEFRHAVLVFKQHAERLRPYGFLKVFWQQN
jgi:hypothetical protein